MPDVGTCAVLELALFESAVRVGLQARGERLERMSDGNVLEHTKLRTDGSINEPDVNEINDASASTVDTDGSFGIVQGSSMSRQETTTPPNSPILVHTSNPARLQPQFLHGRNDK